MSFRKTRLASDQYIYPKNWPVISETMYLVLSSVEGLNVFQITLEIVNLNLNLKSLDKGLFFFICCLTVF